MTKTADITKARARACGEMMLTAISLRNRIDNEMGKDSKAFRMADAAVDELRFQRQQLEAAYLQELRNAGEL